VGNRISQFDLLNNTATTHPYENLANVAVMCLSPDSLLLLSVDVNGHALLVNLHRKVVLAAYNFKAPVNAACFSPNGKYIAVTHEKQVQMWRVPSLVKEFAPFVLVRKFSGHYEDVTCVAWSSDSQYIISGSMDRSVRVWDARVRENQMDEEEEANKYQDSLRGVLSAHRDHLIGCHMTSDHSTIYSVSADGTLCIWGFKSKQPQTPNEEWNDQTEEEPPSLELTGKKRWRLQSKHYFNRHAKATSCAFTPHISTSTTTTSSTSTTTTSSTSTTTTSSTSTTTTTPPSDQTMVAVGFSSGVFGLWLLSTSALAAPFTNIHSLSMGQHPVTTAAVNRTGDWVAFGSERMGQLIVWEWKSESFILKQQGHYFDTNALAFSPNGHYIATGGDDGKVKLWDTMTGFCFVTFSDHMGSVADVCFSPNGTAVYSASADGTVRAFDLRRYRNYRTMTSPELRQFSCVAVDSSGEVVCAGTVAYFEIHLWSTKTGKILDILSGHEAPISAVAFSPLSTALVSSSWDRTVRVWDVFGRHPKTESLSHTHDVLCVAYRPDGREICTATLGGELVFWDTDDVSVKYTIDGRNDISGGRLSNQKRTAKTSMSTKSFTTLCYSADGRCVLAGGNSKYVCIYDTETRSLVKKFQISHNRSLDGVLDMLNSKDVTDAGSLSTLDTDEGPRNYTLPGVSRPDFSKRNVKLRVRTKSLRFSPNGTQWAAATTEGLIVYSLDDALTFDPFDLDVDVSSVSIQSALAKKEYLKAIILALRLGEKEMIHNAYLSVPASEVQFIVSQLPAVHVKRLLENMETITKDAPSRVEFHLLWCIHVLTKHGKDIQKHPREFASTLRALQRNLMSLFTDLSSVADGNGHTLQYLRTLAQLTSAAPLPALAVGTQNTHN